MTSTGPNVRTFLRFLTGRKTLLDLGSFLAWREFVLGNVIKPQGLEPLQFRFAHLRQYRHPETLLEYLGGTALAS